MEASKVYYTSFKTSGSENLLQKLRRLCITAGMKNMKMECVCLEMYRQQSRICFYTVWSFF